MQRRLWYYINTPLRTQSFFKYIRIRYYNVIMRHIVKRFVVDFSTQRTVNSRTNDGRERKNDESMTIISNSVRLPWGNQDFRFVIDIIFLRFRREWPLHTGLAGKYWLHEIVSLVYFQYYHIVSGWSCGAHGF
jgi:hypothetical protein